MTAKRQINQSVNILKILAMLLIINSHSDALYPAKISFLASGGGIGNELFFLISGFLFSEKSDVKKDVWTRFIRLYLPACLMIIFTVCVKGIKIYGVVKAVEVFVWPTYFWFVGAIFLYAVIMYALIRWGIDNKNVFAFFVLIITLIDVLLYIFCIPNKSVWIVEDAYFGFFPYRAVYSFLVFVLGYIVRKHQALIYQRVNSKVMTILAVISFVLFYGFKLMLNRNIVPMSVQIISQPLTIICALCIFFAFIKFDFNSVLEGKRANNIIRQISSITLEFYLVQFLIIEFIYKVNIVFPVNILFCVCLSYVAAELLKFVSDNIRKLIIGR